MVEIVQWRAILVDILIKNGIIVTMDDDRRILDQSAIAIEDNKIVAIGNVEELERRYRAEDVVDASNRIVMPGLVCSHTHLYGMLLRGSSLRISPPGDFTQILQRVWWPVDEALTLEDAYASALVGSLEFAKSGTTFFADTYSGPNSIDGVLDLIAKAVNEVGIRGIIAYEATERHSREEGMRGVEENLRYIEKTRSAGEPKVLPMLSLHASFTVSDELIRYVRQLGSKFRVPITIHTSEGMGDLYHNLERYGKRTVQRLNDVGLLGPDVVLTHCVQVDDEEIGIIKRTQAKVAHNPMSNMLNAVGVAPVTKMMREGITVGLGNDGYVFDPFENMRAAYLLHRVHQGDPGAIDGYSILEMATIGGARLYGLQKQIGSLQVGKRADIIVINPDIMPTPLTPESVVGHLVNTIDGDDVETVLVDGKFILRDRQIVTLDQARIEEASQQGAKELWRRLQEIRPQMDVLSRE